MGTIPLDVLAAARRGMNPLRLEQMTVFDIGPCEMIDLAEAFDIPFVSVFLTEGLPGGRPVTAGRHAGFAQAA